MPIYADPSLVHEIYAERDAAIAAHDRLRRAARALAGLDHVTLGRVTQEAIVTVLEAHKPGAMGLTLSSPPTDAEITAMMDVCWTPGLTSTGFFEHAARELDLSPAELLAEMLAIVEKS